MALVQPEFLQTKTYTALRDRLAFEHGGSLQPGVWDANDYKVVQRAAGANMSVDVGAGFALVDASNAGNAGLYHVENNATTNVVIPAAHATLPRIDQIVVDISDSTSGGDAGDTPAFTVLAGTATSGATLANRTGANPTLPANTLRVADVLVGAAVTSITNTNIQDRRPWARGAYTRVLRTAGDLTRTLSSFIDMDSTLLAPRIECSGAPITVALRGRTSQGALPSALQFQLLVDGTVTGRIAVKRGILSGGADDADIFWSLSLSAGSHVIKPQYSIEAGATTGTVFSNTTHPLEFEIFETVRQVADNGT